MKLGDFIDIILWYKRISKVEFAKSLDTSATSVDRLINDSIKLTPMKMQKLSETLEIPLEILFMWQGYDLAQRYKDSKKD